MKITKRSFVCIFLFLVIQVQAKYAMYGLEETCSLLPGQIGRRGRGCHRPCLEGAGDGATGPAGGGPAPPASQQGAAPPASQPGAGPGDTGHCHCHTATGLGGGGVKGVNWAQGIRQLIWGISQGFPGLADISFQSKRLILNFIQKELIVWYHIVILP